jgi:hypothetical protein
MTEKKLIDATMRRAMTLLPPTLEEEQSRSMAQAMAMWTMKETRKMPTNVCKKSNLLSNDLESKLKSLFTKNIIITLSYGMYVETHSLIIISYWNQFVHVPK